MKSNSNLKTRANQRRSSEYLRIANLVPNHRYRSPPSRIRIRERPSPANTASSIVADTGALPRYGPPSPLRRGGAGAGRTGLRLGGSGAEAVALRGLEELDGEIVEADLREAGAADGVDEPASRSAAIAAVFVVAGGEGRAGGTAEAPGAAVVEGGGVGGVVGGGSSDEGSLGGGFECRGGHRRKGEIEMPNSRVRSCIQKSNAIHSLLVKKRLAEKSRKA